MEYRSISMQEFKDLLEKGQTISGYEIDWVVALDFEELKLVYRGQIHISHCKFNYGLVVKNLRVSEDLFRVSFYRCVFENSSGFMVRFSEFNNIDVKHCEATNIDIADSKIDRINVEDTSVSDGLYVSRMECRSFSVDNKSEVQVKLVFLRSPKLEFAHIRNVHGIDRVLIQNAQEVWLRGNFKEVDIRDDFKRIEILDKWIEESKKSVNSKIDHLRCNLETLNGDLLVSDANVKLLDFSEVNAPTSRVHFKEVIIEETKFLDCSIPHMTWNQVEFVKPPELTGTYFSGLKMSNVKWPKNKELANEFLKERIRPLYFITKYLMSKEDRFDGADTSELKYDIETYRQLKAASIANHNQIESLAFYRNEMKLYWKLIRIEGGIPWYDRLLVFVNRWSSDFGQNWLLPLLWLFGLTTLYYVKLDSPEFSWHPIDWWNGFLEMLSYLNPFRKVNEGMTKVEIGMDVLYKVASAYFIYHFVRASRKFGKV